MAGGSAEGRSLQGPGMALYLLQGTWNWPEGWKGNGEVEGQPVGGGGGGHARLCWLQWWECNRSFAVIFLFFSTLFFAAAPALTWQA